MIAINEAISSLQVVPEPSSSSPISSLLNVSPQKTSWNTMDIKEALSLLEVLPEPPSVEELVSISQNCRKIKQAVYARRLQARVSGLGLDTNETLGNYLVPMLAECGAVSNAQRLFHKLSYCNEYSWSSLAQGFVENGDLWNALDFFRDMQAHCLTPATYAVLALLKACAKLKCVERGAELYQAIIKVGLDDDPFVVNSLLDMYAKSGLLTEAQELFDRLPLKDVVSWNALIGGYLEHGLGEEALSCFQEMQSQGLELTPVTYVSCLKACGSIKSVEKGQEIHYEIAKEGYETDAFVSSALVDMCAKCGLLEEAQDVFDELPDRDVIVWTALICGYTEQEHFDKAFHYFRQMQCDGISPNAVTYICILKACSGTGTLEIGLEVHADMITEELENSPFAGSTLVDMYAKCGSLEDAQDVFDGLTDRDVVAWTAIIAGYTEQGRLDEAMVCVDKMKLEGMPRDSIVCLCILKACASLRALDKGRDMHLEVVQEGFEADLFVGNTLVDMYGKCGMLADAHEVFEEMPIRDIVSWNALISGYTQQGLPEEACKCWQQMLADGISPNIVSWNIKIFGLAERGENEEVFKLHSQMQEQGLVPDTVTLVCMLAASAEAADIKTGKRVHAQVQEGANELGANELNVLTALVDMYSKCGSMADAQQVFDAMPTKDLVVWSALSMGYARQGEFDHFFSLLERMSQENVHPDEYSLHSILTTCSHAGLVGKGQRYLNRVSQDPGIGISYKHHNSMVDLFSRAGRLDEAVALLESMPYGASHVAWCMVLGACRNWGNVELAVDAFEEVMASIDDDELGPAVLMSNIFVSEKNKKMSAISPRGTEWHG